MQQVEMCHTTKKAQSTKRRIKKCANQENRERTEQHRTGSNLNHGRDLGPEPNPPREGGGQADPPWCRRTLGGGKPGPSFSGGCMPPCIGRFHLLANLDATNRPSSTIKREALPLFNTHIIWSQFTSHLSLVSLV